jgi:NAD(P)-dependent dehydrogenase (short-subunit alcohol dehydrogenase family)
MKKTILITGSTDGIGKATAEALVKEGHKVLLHGRNQNKLEAVKSELSKIDGSTNIETYSADLSDFSLVEQLANAASKDHQHIDVLINNAGVYKVPNKTADNGIDIRFVVNTISPYLLTKKLSPLLGSKGRVINLSSAAQAPVDIVALGEANRLSDDTAYAQSKLALTMWSRYLAQTQGDQGPSIIAVNPASFLGSNMVKEAYGMPGKDLQIGVDILVRAALSEEFSSASGLYFDNDKGAFSDPHPDALDPVKIKAVTEKIEEILS